MEAVREMPIAAAEVMRAVVHLRYGEPDVLSTADVPIPTPGPGEVLVRVRAAGASIGDHHVVTGKPYPIRLSPYGGLPRPKNRVPGTALAGTVEAVGANVENVHVGDEVIGDALNGAFAPYAVVPADRIAPKPSALSFEEAAAVPWAITALQAVRDHGRVKAGDRVLIHGASGGVGTWAVQIAKALGAEVTAVCSARNAERMRALGADRVIDYRESDFVAAGPFDVMIDLVGDRTLADCRRALTKRGTYVASSGAGNDWVGPLFRLLALMITSLFVSQKLTTFIAKPNRADLIALGDLVEAGSAKPVIERVYPLHEAGEALRRIGEGHAQGQTVLRVV